MIYLPTVTSLTVDDRISDDVLERLRLITVWHRTFMSFGVEMAVLRGSMSLCGVRELPLCEFNDQKQNAYSNWIHHNLLSSFQTPFVLLYQWDGFALRPSAWRDEFLTYDYIGAPFRRRSIAGLVGNGGFCLRSRRFCEVAAKLPPPVNVPEDIYYTAFNADHFRSAGIRIAPKGLAERWATETYHPTTQFGFHGSYLLNHVWRSVLPKFHRIIELKNGSIWDGEKIVGPKGKGGQT